MKHSLLVMATSILAVFASCNSSKSSRSATSEESPKDHAPSTRAGDAVFSYALDGNKISGGEVDDTRTNNIATLTKSGDGDKVDFFLGDHYQENRETFAHSLRFHVPAKAGTVTLTPDGDNGSVQLFVGSAHDDKYIIYSNEALEFTIASKTANRISGTFSGKLKSVDGPGAGKPELAVTDGKFDVPVRSE
jgi:hypothetical protein